METAADYRDWSGLPEDLVAMVMRTLDIPDLFRAGAVCTSWHSAYSAVRRVRIPITDASPCLLYSCAADDADTATVYSPSSDAAFKVRLPGPTAFRSCNVVGSGHGWVVTVDEEANLRLLNPLTAAQVDLPPVTGLHHVESFSDDQGRLMYNLYGEYPHPLSPCPYEPKKLQLSLYHRAYLSCSPSVGAACVVLLMHLPDGELSFARLGDDRWTHVAESESVQWSTGYSNALYNPNDGLFYLLCGCSIFTLDLNGTSPVTKMIIEEPQWSDVTSIVLAPWGDILQVWRMVDFRDNTGQAPAELAHEVIDPNNEQYTIEIELYKVNINDQKLVKLSSSGLQEHALFLGFNPIMMLSTKDFPMLKPNCAYTTDDNSEHISVNKYGCREVGIWNFETETLESLGNVQSVHPWLNWPPPIWFTPSLS